jgi:DNA ligase D-like protein (predicted ligase)
MPRAQREPPKFIAPQLTLPVPKPPTGDEWGHELKFDGYRLHARIMGNDVRLLTRTGLNWTDKYRDIASALSELRLKSAYIDGELCALRADGTSSFADLQAASDRKTSSNLTYLAFDLLFIDGNDLRATPLRERKARLSIVLAKLPPRIQYVDHIVGDGTRFHALACQHHAEGIVCKRLDAPYRSGDRGLWRKVRCVNEEEFVIVGFSKPQGSRQYLGSLLLGYYTKDGRLIYAGRAGTGMDDKTLKKLHGVLKPLEIKTMSLNEPPPRETRFGSPLKLSEVTWVKPEVVAQVRYLTWTVDGLMRQVVFLGLREDKPANEVVRVQPGT